jgi:hypothetical protein
MEVRRVKSQTKIIQVDSAFQSPFDTYYVGRTEEPDLEISSRPRTSTEKAEPRYIRLYGEKVHLSQEKARQVGWWLGRVEHVYEDHFTAVLEDLNGRTSVAEFDKEEITPSELGLLVPNTRFSYTVTLVDKPSGREYVSKLSLSGPAIWTQRDSERAQASYEKIFPEELLDF